MAESNSKGSQGIGQLSRKLKQSLWVPLYSIIMLVGKDIRCQGILKDEITPTDCCGYIACFPFDI